MAKHRKPTDDLQTVGPTRLADIPGEPPGTRLDFGDVAQQAEMEGLDEVILDEPIGVVDAPAQPREPLSKASKRRNLRG
ncbi:MAG TPA: hypothetical protein VF462_00100 [Micromonosporaceae bacterium]